MMNVFVSRPNWVPDEYKKGLKNFLSFLKKIELEPRTLGVSDFPTKSPLDEVLDIFDEWIVPKKWTVAKHQAMC